MFVSRFIGDTIGRVIGWLMWVILFLPARLLALVALMGLGVVLWLHRKRHNRRGMTGAGAAAVILTRRGLNTRVTAMKGWLTDCYLPKPDVIVLSERTFNSTSIGAVSIAAHEAGHAIQRKRWFAPWIARRLLAWPAGWGVALSLWVWGVGMMLSNQRVLLTAAGCFGLYLLFLLLELVCELDASRRGVRELLRCGILDKGEARIARRVLRATLVTYLAVLAGSALVLTLFLSSLDWHALVAQLPPGAMQHFRGFRGFRAMLPLG